MTQSAKGMVGGAEGGAMPDTLSILPGGGRVRVFACPACGQTIALGSERCRFCSAAIDPKAAEAAADLLERVDRACSEAEEIHSIIEPNEEDCDPLTGKTDDAGLFVSPFLIFRWWYRFGSVRANDEDLICARKYMTKYALYWGALLGVIMVLCILGITLL